jgi:hypothetical protein
MKNKKIDFRTAYIDLLINLLTGTFVLFLLTTLLIAPKIENNQGIKKNADYVITIEWPVTIDCDVDLWIRDPQNNILSYQTPEVGLMYLERDDMGNRRMEFDINGTKMLIDPDNKEFATFRGTFEGEYIVNIHSYSCRDASIKDEGVALKRGVTISVPVVAEIVMINPNYVVVKHVELLLTNVWQEKTLFRFVIDAKKKISSFNYDYVSIRSDKKQ